MKTKVTFELWFFIVYILAVFSLGFLTCLFVQGPNAMEVYQGKTTLEYKVVDGVKIDSTVIYNSKY